MAGQSPTMQRALRGKPPVELAFLADEHRIDHRLEIVVNHLARHTTEEGKGAVMRIQHHLLGLARIGYDSAKQVLCRDIWRL